MRISGYAICNDGNLTTGSGRRMRWIAQQPSIRLPLPSWLVEGNFSACGVQTKINGTLLGKTLVTASLTSPR